MCKRFGKTPAEITCKHLVKLHFRGYSTILGPWNIRYTLALQAITVTKICSYGPEHLFFIYIGAFAPLKPGRLAFKLRQLAK